MIALLATGLLGGTLLGGVLLAPGPAQAARPVVYLSTPSVSSVWPVSKAVTYLNRYTGSKLVRSRCGGSACIVISESSDLGLPNVVAITYPTYGTASQGQRAFRTTIVLNLNARGISAKDRLSTLVHELGHAFGLWRHNTDCSSFMTPSAACRQFRFTTYERAILRKN